jgi:hypothetical protein
MIINSRKEDLFKIAESEGVSHESMLVVMAKAVELTKNPKIKREMFGKDPYIFSASALYTCHGSKKIIQVQLSDCFHVSSVSVRNTTRRLNEILGTPQLGCALCHYEWYPITPQESKFCPRCRHPTGISQELNLTNK